MNLTYPYATIDGYIRDSRNQQPFNKINGTGILEYAGAARVDILTSTVSISYVAVLSGVVHQITDMERNLFVFIYFSQWHSFLCLWCSLIYDGLHLRAVYSTC